MSREHDCTYHRAEKIARSTLAALSLFVSQIGEQPPKVDLKDVLSPRTAIASELRENVSPPNVSGRIVYSSAKGRNSDGDLIDPAFYTADLKNLKQPERFAISRFARDKAFWDNRGNIVFGRSYEVFIYDAKSKQEKRLIGLDDRPGYWNQADCPSFDAKNRRVIVSVNNDKTDLDLYSYNLDGNREQIAKSQYYTAENCGLISPNGKWLAFSKEIPVSHNTQDWGLVLTSYEEGQIKDVSREPIFLRGAVMPLEWSIDGKELLVLTENNNGTSLVLIDAEAKTQKEIIKGASGASFSPDGKYILISKNVGNRGELYLVTRSDGSLIKIADQEGLIFYPNWEKPSAAVSKGVILVGGVTTEIIGGRVRLFTGTTTDDLTIGLVNERNFKGRGKDIFPFSAAGWEQLPDGSVAPKSASCELSLVEINYRARKLIDFIVFLQSIDPEMEIYVITHSEGGVTTDRAFELMMTEGTQVNLKKVKGFYSTHTPHAGVDKPIISWIGEHWPIDMADDCLSRWTPIPSMEIFKTPTGHELLEMWDIRGETRKRLFKMVEWIEKQGIQAVSFINYQDCAISIRTCALPRPFIELRLFFRPPDDEVILSQRLPGAINIERFFGRDSAQGHADVLAKKEGQNMILALVGDQSR